MSKTFSLIPYERVGELVFGMERGKTMALCGQCRASSMYGYPVEDSYMDDYGYMHILCSSKKLLEAVELLPMLTTEELYLEYQGTTILLNQDKDALVEALEAVTDDLTLDEDEEGYTSVKLGLRLYCPEDEVEDVLIHNRHYYDEEQ